MNNFGILFRYEWKKLWKKKITWVMSVIALLCFLWSTVGEIFITYDVVQTDSAGQEHETVVGGYGNHIRDRENARKLDGKVINAEFLKEVGEYYAASVEWSYGTDRYEEIRQILGSVDIWLKNPNEAVSDAANVEQTKEEIALEEAKGMERQLAGAAKEKIQAGNNGLTAAEREYWLAEEKKVERPFRYTYASAWRDILAYIQEIGIWLVMLSAVCLSGIFSGERRRKTDSLILSTRNGKNPVFFAKLLVSVCYALLCLFLLQGICMIRSLCFYGTEGFAAQMQLIFPGCPLGLAMGKAVLLLLGISVLAVVLVAVLCAVLSECSGNSVAVLAVVSGMVWWSMLCVIPAAWRLPAQIQSLSPLCLVSAYTFMDLNTVSVFGLRLTDLQFAYILYPVLTVGLVILGWWKYCRHHAGSR